MKYRLTNNVIIVKGKTKDCIYDLNNGKLYHINKQVSFFIENTINESTEFSDEQNNLILKLIENKIICETTDSQNDYSVFVTDRKIKFAWIEICTNCNLKCIHCYNESSSETISIMSYDEFVSVSNQLAEIGVKKIQIIGGEPFCNKEILNMLKFARTKFDFIEVFTNGTLLNEENCVVIKCLDIKLAISVYSYNETEHDKVTMVKGSYAKTVATINLLNKHKIQHRIATVYMKGLSQGEKNTDLYTLNTKKDVVRLAGRGDINLLTPELLKRKLITSESFSQPINGARVFFNKTFHNCFGNKIYISSNLDVYPCVMERRLSHGNIKENKLKSIIKDEIRKMNKDNINGCKDCEFRYACFDCRPDRIDHSIKNKPYYCTYDVETGTWLDVDSFIKSFFKKLH